MPRPALGMGRNFTGVKKEQLTGVCGAGTLPAAPALHAGSLGFRPDYGRFGTGKDDKVAIVAGDGG
jgi:hypothetical protein